MSIHDDWNEFKNPAKQGIENIKDSLKYGVGDKIADMKDGNTEKKGCLKTALFWIIAVAVIVSLVKSCGSGDVADTTNSNPQTAQSNTADTSTDEQPQNSDNAPTSESLSYLMWQDNYASEHSIELNDFSKQRKKVAEKLSSIGGETMYMTADNMLGANKYKKTVEESDYLYTGDTQDNYADGFGVLLKICDNSFGSIEIDGKYYDIAYIGHFKEGRYSGYGLEFNRPEGNDYSAIVFEDAFEREKPSGDCSGYYLGWVNYVKYEGIFENGRKNGPGNSFYADLVTRKTSANIIGDTPVNKVLYDEVAVGTFKNDELNGDCKIYTVGVPEYQGEMKNGTKNGYGKLYYASGSLEYEGEFKNDMKNGSGVLYDESGNVVYKGEWSNDDYK